MLKESATRMPDVAGKKRRCYADAEFTLYVFYEESMTPWGFQLLFIQRNRRLILSWEEGAGFRAAPFPADSGGSNAGMFLEHDPRIVVDTNELLPRIKAAMSDLAPIARYFVASKLEEYGKPRVPRPRACCYCPAHPRAAWRCVFCEHHICEGCRASETPRTTRCPYRSKRKAAPATHLWSTV